MEGCCERSLYSYAAGSCSGQSVLRLAPESGWSSSAQWCGEVHQEAGLYGAQASPLRLFLQQYALSLRDAVEGGHDLLVYITVLQGRVEGAAQG